MTAASRERFQGLFAAPADAIFVNSRLPMVTLLRAILASRKSFTTSALATQSICWN